MTTLTSTPPISPLLVPRPYQVVDKIEESGDIFSLHVVPVEGELPEFRPAQVSMLGAFGVGEAAISISSATTTTDFHAYTVRDAGPITHALVNTEVGGVITVRGPFGRPWPINEIDTNQLVIIGGGLGIAPLRAAVDEVVDHLYRFDRFAFVYGAKTPSDLVYSDDIERWNSSGAEVSLIVDAGDGDWTGPVGVVPDLLGGDAGDHGANLDWSDTTAFICGPDIMMHFSAAKLLGLGVPSHKIWITLERNMQCGNALCGHCQLGPVIICRDGPVANYADIGPFHQVRDL